MLKTDGVRSNHLEHEQIPIHKPFVAEWSACIRLIIFVEGTVCREARCEKLDGLSGELVGKIRKAVSAETLPHKVVHDSPDWPKPVAWIPAELHRVHGLKVGERAHP